MFRSSHSLCSDEQFNAQREAIISALADKTMADWAAQLSCKLEAAAQAGQTEWVETTLPNLATMLVFTPADPGRAQIRAMARVCLAYCRYWLAYSDIDVDLKLRSAELVRTKGASGFRMHFHWAPDGVESVPKKRRITTPPPLQ